MKLHNVPSELHKLILVGHPLGSGKGLEMR